MRGLTVDGASNTLGCAQNLLYTPSQILRQGLGLHRPCNVEYLVKGNVAGVLDVLLLLAVAWGL